MKNLFKITFGKVFFNVFFILTTLIIFSSVVKNQMITKTIYPLLVPVFLIFFFVKQKYFNIPFISYLIFAFLGDVSFMFFYGELHLKVSSVLYIIGILYLIGMIIPKLRIHRLDKVIGGYLFMVFCISLYFLYCLYVELNMSITNTNEILLFVIKSLSLIVLSFVAFSFYLSTQSKQSVLFLTGVIFLGFSIALGYINMYYVYHWSFEMIDKILYVASLYFMCRYMGVEQKVKSRIKQLTGKNKAVTSYVASLKNVLALK